MYSILEMFYVFSQTDIENLEKSGFNSRTCLLLGKLFTYSFETNVTNFFSKIFLKNFLIKILENNYFTAIRVT